MAGKRKTNNPRNRVKRKNRAGPSGIRNNPAGTPTLRLRDHLMITQNVTGVNVKQINISPTLSSFAAASTQARFYENYRVTRVHYRILPLDTVNMTQGANTLDLVYVYTVPTFNSQIPLAAESSYLGYRECSVRLLQGPH